MYILYKQHIAIGQITKGKGAFPLELRSFSVKALGEKKRKEDRVKQSRLPFARYVRTQLFSMATTIRIYGT